MSAERGWIADPPIPRANEPQEWIEKHRALGHHPYPAPTTKNPEQWKCKCDPDSKWTTYWRILTAEQTRHKFTCMFGGQKRREPERCHYSDSDGTCLTHRRTT